MKKVKVCIDDFWFRSANHYYGKRMACIGLMAIICYGIETLIIKIIME
jgi:hypothetical protein